MADVHVRPGRPDDAADLARIQLSTWRTAYEKIIPASVLDGVSEEMAATQWQASIASPPSPSHRVLVAQEQQWRVGFAAFEPADPDDAAGRDHPEGTISITTMLVEPRWGRRGHGSRLLAAIVDLARTSGFDTAIAWVLAGDTATLQFYRSAGWEPDGAGRVMTMDGASVQEMRLHASLEPSPAEPAS